MDYELLRINYFQNDLPCPYKLKKGGDINIYPILVKDYPLYEYCKEIMEIDKNTVNDFEIIQMSYLDYLVNIIFKQKKELSDKLYTLLHLILKEDKIAIIDDDEKNYIVMLNENEEIKYIIRSKELEEIYKISCYQNNVDYDDTRYSADVQAMINDYYSLKYKNSHFPNLEEMKAFVISKTGILMKDINEMTYRSFYMIYNSSLSSDIYISQKILQASQKYNIDDFQHPLFTKKKNIIDEVFNTDDEKFINKVNNVNNM